MKKAGILLIAALVLTMLGGTPSFAEAEREDVGRVLSMNGSHMVMQTVDGERLRLDVDAGTRIHLEDSRVPVKRLLPDTRVRVSHKDGHATAIFVKAVPK
uniref:Copper-binding protein n=1 Tax=Geobacter sp. (strain M21) TaxID=443144 RepID=C6E168_GEOSM